MTVISSKEEMEKALVYAIEITSVINLEGLFAQEWREFVYD